MSSLLHEACQLFLKTVALRKATNSKEKLLNHKIAKKNISAYFSTHFFKEISIFKKQSDETK